MKTRIRHFMAALLLPLLLSSLAACSQLGYYGQAAQGQISLLQNARSVDSLIASPETPQQLRNRLQAARQMRQFAVDELALPDNSSYRNYAQLKQPFVLWNVVATSSLSLTPLRWCFPVAGCVSYRGYYQHESALEFAQQLRSEGYDVRVEGVPAYSTLGWFNDPLISTFINAPDASLARLIFHELAHQVVYVKDDSAFNESFATAVEQAGVQRWLDKFGNEAMRSNYEKDEGRRKDFLALLRQYRSRLDALYKSNASDQQKLHDKAEIFQALQQDYQSIRSSWGAYAGYDRWFAEPLTNAHFVSVATYNDLVPGFQAMLLQSASFPEFYRSVKQLSERDKSSRNAQLQLLAKQQNAAKSP
ncbi:aminopeptidase [Undibacterium terreum]|uniref:Aminopeptidase n=1 Tax=Undibacterium terreum TaxID=1224302 RepID=A0A916XL57_9BURK|nr:aminopeptidase [Undibacterium terreum]GGC80193.1 aminopeptidase [Undibacterium terreum]